MYTAASFTCCGIPAERYVTLMLTPETELELELHLAGDVKKTDKKVTWLSTAGQELVAAECYDFDYLITKDKPEEEAEERRSLTSIDELSNEERRALERLIQEEMDNPVDPSKPYKTPWKPREFMSPFAFIPRYLEVNQNICSAVYLRHPVARVGSAEVPTPYPFSINQLAFNWYLRRR